MCERRANLACCCDLGCVLIDMIDSHTLQLVTQVVDL